MEKYLIILYKSYEKSFGPANNAFFHLGLIILMQSLSFFLIMEIILFYLGINFPIAIFYIKIAGVIWLVFSLFFERIFDIEKYFDNRSEKITAQKKPIEHYVSIRNSVVVTNLIITILLAAVRHYIKN